MGIISLKLLTTIYTHISQCRARVEADDLHISTKVQSAKSVECGSVSQVRCKNLVLILLTFNFIL